MTPLLLSLGFLLAGPPPGDAVPGVQPSLDPVATDVAQAWQEGDPGALVRVMRPSGIRLHLGEEEHASLAPRQVQAALRDFMARYSSGEVGIMRVALAGGDPSKGFTDIRWRTVASRGSETVTFTLFVAFALEGEAWQITEIRVLSPLPAP